MRFRLLPKSMTLDDRALYYIIHVLFRSLTQKYSATMCLLPVNPVNNHLVVITAAVQRVVSLWTHLSVYRHVTCFILLSQRKLVFNLRVQSWPDWPEQGFTHSTQLNSTQLDLPDTVRGTCRSYSQQRLLPVHTYRQL